MSLPYFNLYPTDFEAKTSHLTLEEDGAYNRLLRLCWMSPGCSLPDDDAWIMRRMRCDQDTFDRVVSVVLDEFFTRSNGRVSNARMTKEFASSSAAHSKRVLAGSKGGSAKALKVNKLVPSNAKAMPKQPEPEPEPEPDIRDLGKPKSCAFLEFWNVWPVKISKASAEKAWSKLSQADRVDAIQSAAMWFDRWRQSNPQANPIHPASFLNQKRWTDEIPQRQFTTINGGNHGHRNSQSHATSQAIAFAGTARRAPSEDCF